MATGLKWGLSGPALSAAQAPIGIGRKSKQKDFNCYNTKATITRDRTPINALDLISILSYLANSMRLVRGVALQNRQ